MPKYHTKILLVGEFPLRVQQADQSCATNVENLLVEEVEEHVELMHFLDFESQEEDFSKKLMKLFMCMK